MSRDKLIGWLVFIEAQWSPEKSPAVKVPAPVCSKLRQAGWLGEDGRISVEGRFVRDLHASDWGVVEPWGDS
jgi:hypothetical protein